MAVCDMASTREWKIGLPAKPESRAALAESSFHLVTSSAATGTARAAMSNSMGGNALGRRISGWPVLLKVGMNFSFGGLSAVLRDSARRPASDSRENPENFGKTRKNLG